jgi:peroxin-2
MSQEFLVFLLPLVRPRRIMKRIMRMQIYDASIQTASRILPSAIKKRIPLLGKKQDAKSEMEKDEANTPNEYSQLPESTCALCWQRHQASRGGSAGFLRVGLPSSDPLDPSSGALAPGQGSTRNVPLANDEDSDDTVNIPHAAVPCGCVYCYHCLASILLSEEGAEDIADEGGWKCLRCRASVRGLQRV